MKSACLDNLSTTTRMAVKPSEGGSCAMKSMDMEFHGFSRTGSCFRRPNGGYRGVLEWVQEVQELTWFLMNVQMPSQVYS